MLVCRCPGLVYCYLFFNETAPTEIYTLSLHDALPIWSNGGASGRRARARAAAPSPAAVTSWPISSRQSASARATSASSSARSEEHTSELQSRQYLVCRLLLEKKNNKLRLHDHVPCVES